MAAKERETLEDLASNAADKAIKRMRTKDHDDDSFSHVAQLDADDGINHEEEGDLVTNFDIFDHCEGLVKSGKHQIKYEIKKNGEMLTTRYHPYSWEQLQKDHKGGHYQVSAKSVTTKKFVKHETRSVAEPEQNRRDEREDDLQHPRTIQQQAPQGPSFTELFTLLNATRESERSAAREASRDASNANNAATLALVEMMKTTSSQSQTMMMEIAKMTAAMTEKLSEQQQKLVERMDAKFEKLVEKIASKPEEKTLSAMDIMALQTEAQNKGFAMFEKMAKLAELKTEERLQLIEDARDERDDRRNSNKKSLTDSLIESVLPTVATALAGQAANRQAPQVARALPPVGTPPTNRGSLPRQHQVPTRTAQTTQPRSRTPENQVQGAAKESSARGEATGRGSRVVNGETGRGSTVTNAMGLPSANFSEDVPLTPTNTVTVTKAKIEEILTPIFGVCLLERKDAPIAATEIEAALKENGIDRPTFLQTVAKEDMMNIAKGYGLPDQAYPWFEEVYANLQGTAGVDVGGEHPAS